MNIREFFDRINKSKLGMLFYLIIIVPLSVVFYMLQSCLFVFFVVFVSMAVPYYGGMRGPKKFAILGVFILISNSLAYGGLSTYRAYDYANYYASYESTRPFVDPQSALLDNLSLSEGFVTPKTGDANTQFIFSVIYAHENNTPPKYVHVNVSNSYLAGVGQIESFNMTPANAGDINYTDGAHYVVSTRLSSWIDSRYWEVPNHFFYFEVEDDNGTYTNTTISSGGYVNLALGPMNAGFLDVFYPNVIWGFSNMIWTIALFYLVVMMYWWLRRAKGRADEWQARMEKIEKEQISEYECDRCGADVPDDADKCPRCGAAFDEGEEEEGEEEEEEEEEGEEEEEEEEE